MSSVYDARLTALRTTILAFSQRFKDIAADATNASKLENKTLSEIIEMIAGSTNSTIEDVETALSTFIARRDNPHEVNKEQVGLGSLQNFAIATSEQAVDEDVSDAYMTPERVWEALTAFWAQKIELAPETLNEIHELASAIQANQDWITVIENQVANKATKAELAAEVQTLESAIAQANDAITAINNSFASNVEAVEGTATDKIMSPASTAAVRTEIENAVDSALGELEDAFQDAIDALDD